LNSNFAKSVRTSLALLLALLAVAFCAPKLPAVGRTAWLRRVLDLARERHSYTFGETNGYYETLMTPGHGKPPSRNFAPVMWLTESEKELTATPGEQMYDAEPFLIYVPKPNLNLPNTLEGLVQTNSHGFFDRERSFAKAPGTRRIIILGDSVIRGTGVTYDQRFDTLLENKLNASGSQRYEILNFGVPGYMLTQMFDVAMQKAPAFHPDVYVIAVTDRTGNPIWAKYVARLAQEGQDLKYDALRKVVQEAGIKKDDSPTVAQWKLAPYRESTMRALFLDLKAHAEQQSAKLIVFFVPSLEEEAVVDPSFRPVRECLQGTGIPLIDASHTFSAFDHDQLRLDWFDQHPNVEGHRMIAENLYNELRENPAAWGDITGVSSSPSLASNHAGR
jgi:hypothetical protein